jgi:two-component system response regulator FixJ
VVRRPPHGPFERAGLTSSTHWIAGETMAEGQMSDTIYYHAFLNRDRLVHIVDADPSTCEALSILFRLEGFQTSFSFDAPGFFQALERRHPDVVVLNFTVGTEDGLGIMRRIKSMRMGTPVFMVSDTGNLELAVQAMKAGASDVVTKPIDSERLVSTVREALRHDIHMGAIQKASA